MRVQEHVKLSAAAAIVVLPWLREGTWIPFVASILIDVDHYLWYVAAYRTLSLRSALQYFGQADPPQLAQARLLHHPFILGTLLFMASRTHSRILWLILAGLLFHVSLDAMHATQMNHLKKALSEQAHYTCPECKQHSETLQLHTVHFARNVLDRYNPRHFVVLCPACHQRAHKT